MKPNPAAHLAELARIAESYSMLRAVEVPPAVLATLVAVARAAQAYFAKVDALSDAVGDAFAFKANHGCPYSGPTWEAERDALKEALANVRDTAGPGGSR